MGLRYEDLKGMFIPLIGVDKFQPKTGTESEVIVVSFHIKEDQAAKDLERFLEMSAVDTLDTEASPNPDEDGHHIVFAEFKRDKSFWLNFKLLLRDIDNVAGNIQWAIDPYKANGLYKLNDAALVELIITDTAEYEFKHQPEEEIESPEFADIVDAIQRDHRLSFKAYAGPYDQMVSRFKLSENVIDSTTNYEQRVLNSYVGATYKINDMYVLEDNDNITVFRRIDNA